MKRLILISVVLLLMGGFVMWYRKNSPLPLSPAPSPSPFSSCAVTIVSPQAGSRVTNPLSINIIVDNSHPGCHWTVFEAQAGIARLEDSKGNFLGQAPLKTAEDWTLSKPTAYNATITLSKTPSLGAVNLILEEENPSGKPHPQKVTIPLSIE